MIAQFERLTFKEIEVTYIHYNIAFNVETNLRFSTKCSKFKHLESKRNLGNSQQISLFSVYLVNMKKLFSLKNFF